MSKIAKVIKSEDFDFNVYECSECGVPVYPEDTHCPLCKAKLDWEGTEIKRTNSETPFMFSPELEMNQEEINALTESDIDDMINKPTFIIKLIYNPDIQVSILANQVRNSPQNAFTFANVHFAETAFSPSLVYLGSPDSNLNFHVKFGWLMNPNISDEGGLISLNTMPLDTSMLSMIDILFDKGFLTSDVIKSFISSKMQG